MAFRYHGEHVGEIAERLDAVELAGLDERGDDRPVLGPGIVSREECILAIQRYRPHGSLDGVIVDLDPAVAQKDAESIPVFGDVGQSFAKRRFASDTGTMMRQPS